MTVVANCVSALHVLATVIERIARLKERPSPQTPAFAAPRTLGPPAQVPGLGTTRR